MVQKVYEGSKPYVFVSYSHDDRELVLKLIEDLMIRGCRLWYDIGDRHGEDYNGEIATHLKKAKCVLYMITSNSIKLGSGYIRNELNFAIKKGIKICPIYLENVELPDELELMIGRLQAISYFDSDVNKEEFKLREKLIKNLPHEVFVSIPIPFYLGENNSFYFENTSILFPEGSYFAGEYQNSFEINIVRNTTNEKVTIWKYEEYPAYDMIFSLNKISIFEDPYFCDENSKVIFLSLALTFISKYPVPWPDYDTVLTIAISRIEEDRPRVIFIDCKIKGNIEDEREKEFIEHHNKVIEDSITQSFKNESSTKD